MKPKQKVVNFYFLKRKLYTNPPTEDNCPDLKKILDDIYSQKLIHRMLDFSENKFVYIDVNTFDSNNIIELVLTCARQKFRANLVDRNTGEERKNPKKKTEGEKEKTHVIIKIEKDETQIIMEKNGNGITINNLIDYLNFMYKRVYGDREFTFAHDVLMKTDLFKEINGMKRIFNTEILVEKQILGDTVLNYSNKITQVQNNVTLTLKANRDGSIKDTVLDCFQLINNAQKAPIRRMIIRGKDDHKNNVVLDTLDFYKKDSAFFELNQLTGEVVTPNAFRILKGFLNQF
jgi:hypothetical protein